MSRPSACGIIKLFATGPSLHHRALFAVPSVMSTNPLAMCCATRRPGGATPSLYIFSFVSHPILRLVCNRTIARIAQSLRPQIAVFLSLPAQRRFWSFLCASAPDCFTSIYCTQSKTQPCRLQHSPKGLSNRRSRLPKQYDTLTMETDTRCKRLREPSTGSGRVQRPTGRKCHS